MVKGPVCVEGAVNQGSTPQPSRLLDQNTSSEDTKAKKNASVVYSAVKVGVGLLGSISPVFGPLESVAGGLTYIIEHQDTLLLENGNEGGIGIRERNLMEKLQDFAKRLQNLEETHGFKKYIAAADDANVISIIIEDIRDAIQEYQVCKAIACASPNY
ncbi:hypothetical protein H0H81_003867 [Sphagnurus paluster]|uniref:Uncharacterized protein n=1 Tax=Sphagnurus paluster TaxID=117069 RepID=A0A9P7FYX8_9AGAR|nr:hypothetical protein H0H81_003867 [Sphagnurus paluster]